MGDKPSFTKSQCWILFALCSAIFGCAVRKSLQAPFFPREAELKGSKASEYGLVFGVFELVSFFVSPFCGKYIGILGVNNMLNIGIFMTGFTSICFGFLDLIDSHEIFITLAFVVRIIESLGASAVFTASFAIIGVVCQGSIATSVAILNVSLNIGFVVGPPIAGYIFELHGFISPFVTLGIVLLLQALVIFAFMPSIDYYTTRLDNTVPIMSVLTLVPVALNLFSTGAASSTIGFLATLEPHLRQFALHPVSIGLIFMILPTANLLATLLVGYLCDARVHPKGFVILGSVLIILGFSLIGPALYVPVKTTIWIICVGLALHGIGFSSIFVASFSDAIHSAIACGLPNDMGLSGVVSGLSRAAFALGDTLGPTVAGFLYDAVGYPQSILFVIVIHVILVVTISCHVWLKYPAQETCAVYFQTSSCDILMEKLGNGQDENEPIAGPSNNHEAEERMKLASTKENKQYGT